ncbi:MAG: AgmX/PglI C-terminal domain-containing protein [Polyangiaceae bacterium]
MSSPSSRPPAGVPASGGNVKYAAVAALLVLAIGALFTWRSVASKSPPAPAPTVPPPVASAEPADPKLEEIPPPPPVEEKAEAGPGGPRVVYVQAGGCDAKCVGTAPPELTQALQVRGMQARRCYNQALSQDPSLRGHVQIALRIGTAGNVCSANVSANDMRTPNVANCAAHILMGGSYPAPKGGCVEAVVPMSFVPQGQ